MARIVGGKLLEENIIHKGSEDPSFKDIKNRPMEEQNSIKALYNAGIIEGGENSTKYNPNRLATQAEAIVLLQRVEKVLDQNTIPFNLSGIIQAYSGNEGIIIKENSDKIVLSITKSFPTPGYNMEVEKITRGEDNYKIHLNITPPPKDSEQLQVITFKTITIEINKKHITPPYIL